MTFETAASIPINYSTAYQALVETARLQPGESILIHGAAGGVGQAAIMMALNIGAEENPPPQHLRHPCRPHLQ